MFDLKAERKLTMSTPKKVVPKNTSSCRLCEAVVDRHYCKNIFNKKNSLLLSAAEEIFGGPLHQLQSFPTHLCRPCERRLTNFNSFQQIIRQSQASLQASAEKRFKRVLEMSPSAPVTIKSCKASAKECSVATARRGLDFPASQEPDVSFKHIQQ